LLSQNRFPLKYRIDAILNFFFNFLLTTLLFFVTGIENNRPHCF